jgi:hypothetical protein
MAKPQIFVTDRGTELIVPVGNDPRTGLKIDLTGATVKLDVKLPSGSFVEWSGVIYAQDSNAIQYFMVANDYFLGDYTVWAKAIFAAGTSEFTGKEFNFEVIERT